MRLLAVVVTALAFMTTPAAAGNACGPQITPHDAADPAALAAAWLPELERLNAAIPSLSPREEQWLKDEMAGDSGRWLRAHNSREFAMQSAKRDAVNLLSLVRRLQQARDQSHQVRNWLLLAYSLLGDEAPHGLARLVAEGVVKRDAIPWPWTFLAGEGKLETNIVIFGRSRLAKHILICTLPAVLGILISD